MAGTITKSTTSGGIVVQSPAALLEAARRIDGKLTQDEYTLARVVASEAGNEPQAHQLAIAACDFNRAQQANSSIHNTSTGRSGKYGTQDTVRPVSTRLDPTLAHVFVARQVIAGRRIVAPDAIYYFNPRTQYACWAKPRECTGGKPGLNFNQHPDAILLKWSFNVKATGSCSRDELDRYRCPYGTPAGPKNQWVGQIPGIDPWRLMVFGTKPTADHQKRFEEAKAVIAAGMKGTSSAYVEGVKKALGDPALIAAGIAAGVVLIAMRRKT